MILCDTNVLVALADERDSLNIQALKDLAALSRRGLMLTEPVLCESLHLLSTQALRDRLFKFITLLPIQLCPAPDRDEMVPLTFQWLEKYAEHIPDWADAHLAVLCGSDRRLSVWTYDQEFQSIWRRPDGSRIPVVGRRRI